MSKLNEMPLNKWHKHTKRLNPAGTVTQELKKRAHPELMTQAWQKFYECFQGFNLGPRKRTGEDLEEQILFNSVHLCEAPGAFVTSLNHALSVSYPGTAWSWLATTLNPHYEGNDLGYMINDDRFIMGSLDNWFFGEDDTGDLLDKRNADKLVDKAREAEGGIHLVTADGSIDCQGEPARQESIVADLHLAEALVAMRMLSPGGSLVLKMFTFFESETVCLLYLLNLDFFPCSLQFVLDSVSLRSRYSAGDSSDDTGDLVFDFDVDLGGSINDNLFGVVQFLNDNWFEFFNLSLNVVFQVSLEFVDSVLDFFHNIIGIFDDLDSEFVNADMDF